MHLRTESVHLGIEPVHLRTEPVHLGIEPVHLRTGPLHLRTEPVHLCLVQEIDTRSGDEVHWLNVNLGKGDGKGVQ